MINHFNFKSCNSEFLITNDFGEYAFLSKEEFKKFVTETLTEEDEIYPALLDMGFLTNKTREQFCFEMAYKLKDMKRYTFQGTSLHIFAITNRCNMNCVYCQAKAPDSTLKGMMAPETARKAVEIAMESPAKYITIEFQGGEPLLNFPVIREVVAYSKELNAQRPTEMQKDIAYTIASNLLAVTPEIADFFRENQLQVSTSLDGCLEVHDKNRPLLGGGGTFLKVKEKIQFLKQYNVPVSATQTTTRYSLEKAQEIVNAYLDAGIGSIFIRPLTPLGFAQAYWKEIGYEPEEFVEFYRQVLDYVIEINRKGINFPETHATILLKKILLGESENYMELRSPCGATCGQMCYYYDGNVYTCDEGRMVAEMGNTAFQLGNVFENSYEDLVESPVCKTTVASSILESLPSCSDCVYHPYCGVCPVVTFASEHDVVSTNPSNYRCRVYKGMLDVLFEKVKENDPETMEIFQRWTGE